MLVALTPDDDVYAELYVDGVTDIVTVRVVDQSSPAPPGGPFLASHAESAAGPRLLRGQFITELVRRQTKRKCVFNAGPKQILVWGKCSGADVQEISS